MLPRYILNSSPNTYQLRLRIMIIRGAPIHWTSTYYASIGRQVKCAGFACLNFDGTVPLSTKRNYAVEVGNTAKNFGKDHLLVVGTGWGGYSLLRHVDTSKFNITVVSPRNHFLFTPLLPGTAVGSLEFRCIVEPIRRLGKPINYYEAFCEQIDFDQQRVICRSAVSGRAVTNGSANATFELPYDKLVIACGALSNTFNIPGVREHALFLKEVSDAQRIRQRVSDLFEIAILPSTSIKMKSQLLHFAIVGGGPTGIEFSAELHDFIHQEVRNMYPSLIPYVKVTVFDVAERILGAFDSSLSAHAAKTFQRDGIDIRTLTRVHQVYADRLAVQNVNSQVADIEDIPTGLVVWSTGIGPTPLISQLNSTVSTDRRTQRIVTDPFLRIKKGNSEDPYYNAYALGDCAVIDGDNLPATAQVASQKGRYLGKRLENTSPFRYHHRGIMAYIGDRRALIERPKSDDQSSKREGRIAWLIWRSAYFSMTVSWKNRILIPMYWFLTWAFGRDITRF